MSNLKQIKNRPCGNCHADHKGETYCKMVDLVIEEGLEEWEKDKLGCCGGETMHPQREWSRLHKEKVIVWLKSFAEKIYNETRDEALKEVEDILTNEIALAHTTKSGKTSRLTSAFMRIKGLKDKKYENLTNNIRERERV